MAKQSILTEGQHKRAHALYMRDGRPAKEIAAVLNVEFQADGLNVTPRQIVEYASTRDWAAKKKALRVKGEAKASQLITSMATQIAAQKVAQLEKHRDFIDASVRIGGKVIQKAEAIVDVTSNARDLASAANAAAKGIEIYRKAVGLDDAGSGGGGGSGNGATYVFNFARSNESPFTKQAEPVNTEGEKEIVDVESQDKSDSILAR